MFDKDLEFWTNDGDNWKHKWGLHHHGATNAAVCLLARNAKGTALGPKRPSWLAEEADDTPDTGIVKARLWSPRIPSKTGMKCLTLAYKISLRDRQPVPAGHGASLSLLQRQEG